MSQILLVEDSQVQAIVSRQILENAGFMVGHAATVEEALKICYENTPDLVVSDQIWVKSPGWKCVGGSRVTLRCRSFPC
jgi:CheY-like chemotaxis protein